MCFIYSKKRSLCIVQAAHSAIHISMLNTKPICNHKHWFNNNFPTEPWLAGGPLKSQALTGALFPCGQNWCSSWIQRITHWFFAHNLHA